jgi:hypothetical protein
MTTNETAGWEPAVKLDLDTASPAALEEAIEKFNKHFADLPLPPLPVGNGWNEITQRMAEDLLRRNRGNRRPSLRYIRKYARAMLLKEWKRTGEPVLINIEGWVEDAAHRLWACYFSGATFPTYVVTDVPIEPNLFAFIDNGKSRSAADALYTAGNNGISSMVAAAVKVAWRYDNGALKVMSLPRIRDMEPIEVLHYVDGNKLLTDVGHILVGNYGKAVTTIGNKGVALFFAWKVAELYSKKTLDGFLGPLGSGANLDEASPILAVRNRLIAFGSPEDDLKMQQVLGLLIKAFNMHVSGQTMKVTKRQGAEPLFLQDNEEFPRFLDPEDHTSLPVAAE